MPEAEAPACKFDLDTDLYLSRIRWSRGAQQRRGSRIGKLRPIRCVLAASSPRAASCLCKAPSRRSQVRPPSSDAQVRLRRPACASVEEAGLGRCTVRLTQLVDTVMWLCAADPGFGQAAMTGHAIDEFLGAAAASPSPPRPMRYRATRGLNTSMLMQLRCPQAAVEGMQVL